MWEEESESFCQEKKKLNRSFTNLQFVRYRFPYISRMGYDPKGWRKEGHMDTLRSLHEVRYTLLSFTFSSDDFNVDDLYVPPFLCGCLTTGIPVSHSSPEEVSGTTTDEM